MVDFENCKIEKICIHEIKNSGSEFKLVTSGKEIDLNNKILHNILLKYFMSAINIFEQFRFDKESNKVYDICNNILTNISDINANSINIAETYYEYISKNKIKPAYIFVVHFTNILFDEKTVDAVGVFFSECSQTYVKVNKNEDYNINYDFGINTDKPEKGFVVFNLEQENGYKICCYNKSDKTTEAQLLKDEFLKIIPCNNEYNSTSTFLNLTKSYITQQLPDEFQIEKADKIDLLNRSVSYFKNNEKFDKNEFENEVFQNKEIIQSFRTFEDAYSDSNGVNYNDKFDISEQAVKKQSKNFKSILKLDKNFHIYIHGNRQLIEKGFDDSNGLNYYKVYFKEEN